MKAKLLTRTAFSLILIILLSMTLQPVQALSESEAELDSNLLSGSNDPKQNEAMLYIRGQSYEDYLNSLSSTKAGTDIITLVPDESIISEDSAASIQKNVGGRDDVLVWESEQGWVEWTFEVQTPGLYRIRIDYYNLPGKGRDIELALMVNGSFPYDSLKKLTFSRVYQDEGPILRDDRGNEMRPRQVEVQTWQSVCLTDTDGLYNEPLEVWLDSGTNCLRFLSIREKIAIGSVTIEPRTDLPSYEEKLKEYRSLGIEEASGEPLALIQAERPLYKSHATIYPMFDRSSVATLSHDGSLNHPAQIRLNTIGQWNWQYSGQWISFTIDVPEEGLYAIDFRTRQNFYRGMNSTRSLLINGEIPFAEAQSLEFPYQNDWYILTPQQENGEPYLFYFHKGVNEIALRVSLGEMARTLRTVEKVVYELNQIYRKIIKITGANPDESRIVVDTVRDFYLDQRIPGMMDTFKNVIAVLKDEKAHIEQLTGTYGSEAATLQELIYQLEGFILEPETIPSRLERFRSNISNLGGWILYMREQPLELDYIEVRPADAAPPQANVGFFERFWFGLKVFLASFVVDYRSVGKVYEDKEALNVWVSQNDIVLSGHSSGRDQTQIIKNLVDDLFTQTYGIPVNISLVDSSQTLTQAVLAGKGPDVALIVPKTMPVNLAMRGALVELSQFPEFETDKKRFFESAFIAFDYEGKIYALPETQIYDMFFYRKDIFSELGITAPNTWDEFYDIVPVIQKNNMQIGIPEDQRIFETLIFQKGGQFYTNDRRQTCLDQPEALDAFKEWTGFYKKYSFPLVFDFYNRFRTGEMPCGIQPYTMYNLLSVAAPELRNLWDMAPIPATVRPDGSLSRTCGSNSTGSIILRDCKDIHGAYQFISWWTSAEVQARYGTELEYLMGPAARYPTANIEAFSRLPWSGAEADNLMTQWRDVWDNYQLPGNYYTQRNISFAFRRVVYDWANERETLHKFNQEINRELMRKRVEFGLEQGG